jgi:hypothetical protein
MATPSVFDHNTVAIDSAASSVAPSDLAAAIATTHPHPSASPPFVTANASTPAGAVGSLAAATTVGAPAGTTVGTVVGHFPAGLLFPAADVSIPAGPTAYTVGPLEAAAAVGTPADTVVGVVAGRPSLPRCAPVRPTAGAVGPLDTVTATGAPA